MSKAICYAAIAGALCFYSPITPDQFAMPKEVLVAALLVLGLGVVR